MDLINSLYQRFRIWFSKHYPALYHLCDRYKEFIKFFVAGSSAGVTNLVLLYFFYGLLKFDVILSTSIAFILSFLVSFVLQKLWTFRNYSREQVTRQLILYVINIAIGLGLNAWLMHLLVNVWSVWYMLAGVLVNLFIGIWNYIVYRYLVFKE